MSETYSVVVSGQLVDGFNREQVGQNLQKAFKLVPAQVEKLLCGKPVALKRGLERAAAVKLSERLQALGAVSMVKASAAGKVDKLKADAVKTTVAASAVEAARSEPALKAVADKPAAVSEVPVKAADKPAEVAADAPAAAVRAEPTGEAAQAAIECPRCGHEQAFSTTCGLCKMDLTMHIRRMERRAKVVDQIRKQRQR